MDSLIGEWEEVTLAVEEQKMNLGGWGLADERARERRLRRPRI